MKFFIYTVLIIGFLVVISGFSLFLYVYGPIYPTGDITYDLDKLRHFVTYCYQEDIDNAQNILLDPNSQIDPSNKTLETLTMREYDFLFLTNSERNEFSSQGADATMKTIKVTDEIMNSDLKEEQKESIKKALHNIGKTLQTNHFLKIYNMLGDALVKRYPMKE